MNPLRRAWNWFRGLFNWYEGARFSTERSRIPAAVQSARFDAAKSTRMELVRKSRYFEQNNAIYNRLCDLFECYTVGTGHQITPNSSDPEWNERAKAWWEGWEQNCDMVSRQGFGTLMGLMSRCGFVDGGCFIKLGYGESRNPRIQLIEGHMCATPPEFADQEGGRIIDGVIVDGRGRPVGYYIGQEDASGRKVKYEPFSTRVLLHYFEPSRPGQYREIPLCHPVINELQDLDDLHILEMKAARDASEVTNVLKNAAGELSPADLRRLRATRNVTLSDSSSATENRSSYIQDTAGGRTVVLKTNEELEQHRSDRPSIVMTDYWRYKTELVCNGIGIPYCLVFPTSIQGTVYRGVLDMANSWFRSRFECVAQIERQIYSFVMNWARYNVRELADAPADWWKVSIQPPRAVNVDVGRNSAAMLAELEVGATTYEDIYGPLGKNWRDKFDQLKEQRDYAESIGLELRPQPQTLPQQDGTEPKQEPQKQAA